MGQLNKGQHSLGSSGSKAYDHAGAQFENVNISQMASDQKERQGSSGLRQEQLVRVQLERDSIGLTEEVMQFDLPSPGDSANRYGNISLSESEIEKCRRACLTDTVVNEAPNSELFEPPDKGENIYFVELPGEDVEMCPSEVKVLPSEDEASITLGLSNLLQLKGPRLTWAEEEGSNEMVSADGSKRLKK